MSKLTSTVRLLGGNDLSQGRGAVGASQPLFADQQAMVTVMHTLVTLPLRRGGKEGR